MRHHRKKLLFTFFAFLFLTTACGSEDAVVDPEAVKAACDGGSAGDCRTLGLWAETGMFDMPVDTAQAVNLYAKSCELGDAVGCIVLAGLHRDGVGVAVDLERAAELYGGACTAEAAEACYFLGELYEAGMGVLQDSARARELFRTSCELVELGCRRVPSEERPPPPERAVTPPRYTTAPLLLNRAEVVDLIEQVYPRHLRRAGVEGTVRVNFFIGRDGVLEEVRLSESSGNDELDAAALEVALRFEFGAAWRRVVPVATWVEMPVTFQRATCYASRYQLPCG